MGNVNRRPAGSSSSHLLGVVNHCVGCCVNGIVGRLQRAECGLDLALFLGNVTVGLSAQTQGRCGLSELVFCFEFADALVQRIDAFGQVAL